MRSFNKLNAEWLWQTNTSAPGNKAGLYGAEVTDARYVAAPRLLGLRFVDIYGIYISCPGPRWPWLSSNQVEATTTWCCLLSVHIMCCTWTILRAWIQTKHTSMANWPSFKLPSHTAVCATSFLRFGDELSEIGTKLKLPVPWLRGFMRRWGFSRP